jgi:hypothetical protein
LHFEKSNTSSLDTDFVAAIDLTYSWIAMKSTSSIGEHARARVKSLLKNSGAGLLPRAFIFTAFLRGGVGKCTLRGALDFYQFRGAPAT